MKITLQKSNQLQSIAILMMLCLHLFNRDFNGLFHPLVFIGNQPLSYYISLFSDACVPIFAFVSGYGLYFSYTANPQSYLKKNIERTKKLYIRYWLILLLFVVVLGFILRKEGYPGSWDAFILTFTGISPKYNGAWWFFTTYILFVFTSKFWFKILNNINPVMYIFFLGFIYVTSFYFRIYKTGLFENPILIWFHKQAALYFCTLFQFMLGAFALKYNWYCKVSLLFKNIKNVNLISFLGIICVIIIHGFIPNFIIAPFTSLVFIFLFLQLKLSKSFENVLDFFAIHSANLWLIHMFFYMVYFENFIYGFKYVVPIYFALLACSLLSSFLINKLYQPIVKFLR